MESLQQLSAMGRFRIRFGDSLLRSFLAGLQIVSFDFEEVFMLGCGFPASALAIFCSMLFLTLSSALVLLAIHIFAVLFHHKSQFSLRQPVLISATGSIFIVLFTPLVVVAIRRFRCRLNPNKKWAVQT